MMGAILFRGAAFALVWWALAEGRADSWGVGAVSVAAALAASLILAPPGAGRLSVVGLFGYAGFFLIQSVRGGSQVAARAFRPRMGLAPALVEVAVVLPEGLPRVLLVNTLNLLPGTVCIRLTDDRLHLHVLDVSQPITEEVREVESRILRMLGSKP